MPERNAVEIAEHGDQIRPNGPEQDPKQGNHHQHGDTQRLLVNLLQRDGRLFLRLCALRPFFHQVLTTRQRTTPGDTTRRDAQSTQHSLVQQVPENDQINRFNPASRQAQRGVEIAGCRQHH